MSENHIRFKYSATCKTDDLAVLYCLRSLVQLVEDEYPQIGWGGTGKAEWQAAGHQVKFRFTSDARRSQFIGEANRLFAAAWGLAATSDDDAAAPRRRFSGAGSR